LSHLNAGTYVSKKNEIVRTRAHARWCWRATLTPKSFHECASCENEIVAQKDLIMDWKV